MTKPLDRQQLLRQLENNVNAITAMVILIAFFVGVTTGLVAARFR